MMLQKPKLRAQVHEIIGRPDSNSSELSISWSCPKWLSCGQPPITGSSPPKLLLGRGREGRGLLLNTSLSHYKKPLESSLGLRLQAGAFLSKLLLLTASHAHTEHTLSWVPIAVTCLY